MIELLPEPVCPTNATAVALVGHTGSGKSSIMNVLFRFYDIEKGDVKIDGRSIYDMSRQEIRKHMGIVPRANSSLANWLTMPVIG